MDLFKEQCKQWQKTQVVLESKVEQLEKELQETRQTHRQEVERLQKELQKGLATFLRPRASCQELAV